MDDDAEEQEAPVMLIPVQVSPGRRIWVDFSIYYDEQINSTGELTRYIIKYGLVDSIHEDEEIAHDVRRTCYGLLRTGAPTTRVVEEVSAIYGIPEACVEEIVEALPVEEIMEAAPAV